MMRKRTSTKSFSVAMPRSGMPRREAVVAAPLRKQEVKEGNGCVSELIRASTQLG